MSIYGIAQYVFGWDTQNAWIDEEMFENATMRAYSTMENPNVLGEYLLLLIPLCAFLFITSSAKTIQKWFWLLAAGAGTLCMVLTQSRGCWIGLFLAAAIFVTFYNGKLWGRLPFILLAMPFVVPKRRKSGRLLHLIQGIYMAWNSLYAARFLDWRNRYG